MRCVGGVKAKSANVGDCGWGLVGCTFGGVGTAADFLGGRGGGSYRNCEFWYFDGMDKRHTFFLLFTHVIIYHKSPTWLPLSGVGEMYARSNSNVHISIILNGEREACKVLCDLLAMGVAKYMYIKQ